MNSKNLRYKTIQNAITNQWEYFKIEKDKKLKLSEYLKSTWPQYNGTISQLDRNGIQLNPDNWKYNDKKNITEYFLALEIDISISFVEEDDSSLKLLATVEKEDGNIEQYELIKNVKNIKFTSCIFDKDIFIRSDLNSLIFENCIFKERCYINNQYEKNTTAISINNIIIKKTIFHKNFKLHNILINKFHIIDSDFIKNADFFKSHFNNGLDNKQISFHSINFYELALFGKAIFDNFLQFKYVTFRGYTHFRSATFNNGLDLEYANIEKEMNFFNIKNLDEKRSKEKTSQETYRIVKYQLDKVGNIIDANRYGALELDKHRINICSREDINLELFSDGIVAILHFISSNNSRYWFVPLFWITVTSFITVVMLEKDYYNINLLLQYLSILNKFNQFKIHCEISYFVVLFNKVSLGYLYYQFLTAVRKNTRK